VAYLLAYVAFVVMLAGHVVAHGLGRRAAARVLRMPARGTGFASIEDDVWSHASLPARVAVRAAGVPASYAWVALLATLGALAGGRFEADEKSLRVGVSPDGPAWSAGMRGGDRIVAIDGAPVQDWEEIKRRIGAHKGEPVEVDVEREGARKVFSPVTNRDGKVLIAPEYRHVDLGIGGALGVGATQPAEVVAVQISGAARMLVGAKKAELMGPVGIVAETHGDTVEALRTLAVLAAYEIPVTALLVLAPAARIGRRRQTSA
jgi:regulator of sigma E protease